MPGDPPVIERLKPETQIHEAEAEFSQNAPPTIRDSQAPMPKPSDPPIVRGSLIQPQTTQAQMLVAGNFGVVGFAPPDTPIVRGTRIPKQPAPKPPDTSPVPAAGSKPGDPHPTLRPAEPPTVRDFWLQAV